MWCSALSIFDDVASRLLAACGMEKFPCFWFLGGTARGRRRRSIERRRRILGRQPAAARALGAAKPVVLAPGGGGRVSTVAPIAAARPWSSATWPSYGTRTWCSCTGGGWTTARRDARRLRLLPGGPAAACSLRHGTCQSCRTRRVQTRHTDVSFLTRSL